MPHSTDLIYNLKELTDAELQEEARGVERYIQMFCQDLKSSQKRRR